MKKLDRLLLTILALALLLRMGWPAWAEFKRDEATVVRRAQAIAYDGDRPAAGVVASFGAYNLPLTLYLTAIPLRLWDDPLAAVLFVGLLNGLAVLTCYGLGRAYFDRRAGLIAAFLFAVNPWAVMYARKVWCRTLPLATLLLIAALLALLVRKRPWALALAFVALAILIGLQLEGIACIPLLLLLLLLYRREVKPGPLAAGAAFFGLAMLPFVVDDAVHGWPSARSFLGLVGGEARWSLDALDYALALGGGRGIEGLAGGLVPQFLAGLPDLWWLNGLMIALLAAALVYAAVQAVRGPRERRRSLVVLLLWFAVPVLLQLRAPVVHPHYFVMLYPLQFLLVGVLLSDLLARWPRPALRLAGRSLSLAALLTVAGLLLWGGWQMAVCGRVLYFMQRHPTSGGYGIPLAYPRQAAQQALDLADGAEVIVLSDGMDPLLDEPVAVFDALLHGHPHRFADGNWAIPVPDNPHTVYLVGPLAAEGSGIDPVWRRLAAMDAVDVGPALTLPDGWSYHTFVRRAADRADVLAGLEPFSPPARFANGVTFLGRALPSTVRPGETLELWLAWWVEGTPTAGVDVHFFTHLLDEQGALRAQHDGVGFPSAAWRSGDLALQRFTILVPDDMPAGRATVRTGMYSFPDLVGVSVLDTAGNPAGDNLILGDVLCQP